MNFESIFVSLITGLITSVVGALIYDSIFRNSDYEPAYLFTKKFYPMKSKIEFDKRQNNRQFAFNIFFVAFILYLIWAALYVPLVIKAGLISDFVDLSRSNVSIIFGIDKEYLHFNLSTLKWICLFVAIILFFPALFIGTQVSKIFFYFKDQFYEPTESDWRIFRLYGIICFIAMILALNIYLISTMPFWNSFILAVVVIVGFILRANSNS